MCYIRAGLPITVNDKYFSPYIPNTKPEKFINEQEIENSKKLFSTAIDKLQSDFDKKMFENYSPSATTPKVYGVEVNKINEAIDFLLYHKGFHGGYIISLKHLLQNYRDLTLSANMPAANIGFMQWWLTNIFSS